jgi:cell division protein FtsI/penicillin-binding protein 2
MRVGEHKEALVGRVRVLSGVVGVCLAMIAGAFWFVQVVRGSYYRDLAENNRLRKVAIKAPRGSIYDRNGRVMVENRDSDTNVYDPDYLTYRATTLAPGQVFGGTAYPYQIMQKDPARWIRDMGLPTDVEQSIFSGAAGRFLAEAL